MKIKQNKQNINELVEKIKQDISYKFYLEIDWHACDGGRREKNWQELIRHRLELDALYEQYPDLFEDIEGYTKTGYCYFTGHLDPLDAWSSDRPLFHLKEQNIKDRHRQYCEKHGMDHEVEWADLHAVSYAEWRNSDEGQQALKFWKEKQRK